MKKQDNTAFLKAFGESLRKHRKLKGFTQEQLANDFHKVYDEMYNLKSSDDMEEFLKSKKFIVKEFNDMTEKETNKIVAKFGEDFEAMEENIETIFS